MISLTAPPTESMTRGFFLMLKATTILTAVLLAYAGIYLMFGPWDHFEHISASVELPERQLKAEVYRKGRGYSWQAWVRVLHNNEVVANKLIAGFDLREEIDTYFHEVSFDPSFTKVAVGPHCSRMTDKRDFLYVDIPAPSPGQPPN